MLTPDYAKHMDILQDINLRLVEWFNKERIVFSTPQRVYYVETQAGGAHSTLEQGGEHERADVERQLSYFRSPCRWRGRGSPGACVCSSASMKRRVQAAMSLRRSTFIISA